MSIQSFKHAIETNALLRIAVLVVPLSVMGIVGFWLSLSEIQRSIVGLKAAYFLGYILPAIAIGGIIGWITYSRKLWLWWTFCLLILTLVLWLKYH
jgi:hypothetical protein